MKLIHTNYKKLAFALLFLFAGAAFASNDEDAVKNAYKKWCTAIGKAKGNPHIVVKYYAPHAVLLPTLSPKILINTEGGLNEYFTRLTSYPSIRCSTEKIITHIHGHVATNSGLYDFIYTDPNGDTVKIPARFTFVYKKIDNKWMIVKHHSSKVPTNP